MHSPFYTQNELATLGLGSYGENVFISRKCSFFKPDQIHLGNHVRIDDFTVFSGGEGIYIGNYVHIACFTSLYGGGGIKIGDYSTLSSRCAVYSVSDDFSGASMTNPMVSDEYKPGLIEAPVIIGAHVVVGTNSTIMPGIELEEGVAIGAHSFITKNCNKWSIYAGVPACFIKDRKRDILIFAERHKQNTPS